MIEGGQRDFASVHFSTRELAPSKRLPALRNLFDRAVQLEVNAEPGLAVEMTMNLAPGLRRARMLSALTANLSRPAQMLADGEDTVCLMVKTSGHMALSQGQREAIPEVGDGVLLVYREPAVVKFVGATYLSVRVPFAALATCSNVEAAAGRCIRRDTEALSLLGAYIASLPERFADTRLARLAATHVYDLIGLAIGATSEGREIASQRGVRAARLEVIKSELTKDAELDLDQLAARQGVTPRYVQMLFEQAGTTFSEFVLERRLDAARSMLISPRYTRWSITEIALEAGFGDLSHFNRRFKRRFLMTPTELRRHTQADSSLAPTFPVR